MYAIVRTGGKQYRVSENQLLRVEKLDVGVGGEVRLDEVLVLGGEGATTIGSPTVSGAAVVARVVEQGRGRKIRGFTFKAKKNQRRRFGHRQHYTALRIEAIEAPGAPTRRRSAAATPAPAPADQPATTGEEPTVTAGEPAEA
jgi:large subunit ribosomal protein L21